MKFSIRAATFVVFIAASIPLPLVAAGFPASVSISLFSKPQLVGDTLYDVSVLGSLGFPTETITSPTGRIFQNFPSPSPGLTGLTQADALAELTGQWTIARSPLFGPALPKETYTFSISPISMTSLFTIPATITSPLGGSTVPTHFVVNFEWPVDVTPPNGRVASWSNGPTIASVQTGVAGGKNFFPVDVAFKSGQTEGQLTLYAGTGQSLPQYVSAVTTSVVNPSWAYSVGLQYFNLSAPVTVTVSSVPEPDPLAMSVFFAFGAATCSPRRQNLSWRY